ncbi:flagellar export chaperone FlgN [Desulfobacter latus]|uniref:Flagellar export chaperone FlgN n=1 Tax=Desulfobacter latus TaxID=2292 RepID=A0A850T6T7_9BACT|nr:flagellar export chaperone FlgN [Desulfobacter latus]NWH04078.1 flagellar export chaperone FlgN [Desulfobacter latus]
MEKAIDNIQTLLKEKLACYQQLHLVLKAEKKAIGTIDLGMIWETTRAKKNLIGKIEDLRNNILAVCQNHFSGMDKITEPFSLGALIHALPLPNRRKNDIRQLKRTIDKEKDIVAHFIEYNHIQVKKQMSIVDSIMNLFGNNVARNQYTGKGMMTRRRKNNCLFMAQV